MKERSRYKEVRAAMASARRVEDVRQVRDRSADDIIEQMLVEARKERTVRP